MYKSILFDLDGTLADTTEGVCKSAEYSLKKMNVPEKDFGDLNRFIGPPLQATYKSIYKMNDGDVKRAVNFFREFYGAKGVLMCRPYDKMNELLLKLKSAGYKLGTATYKKECYAKILLKDKFSDAFDVIMGADGEGKLTKSQIIRSVIEKLGASCGETVLIGDTMFDLEGAKEAGIDFIAVTYGFGFKTESDLKGEKYVACLKNVSEIGEFFSV